MENNFVKNIKLFLQDKHNILFLVILLFIFILGLYFFSITKNQPLWWDEADYLAYAKNIAGYNVDWIVTEKHNSIFPYIVSIFFYLGISETSIKFLVEFIPLMLIVFMSYFAASSMYNKKTGLITSLLIGTLWAVLFNSMRFHVDIPAMLFGILAIYLFWEGYEKKNNLFGFINYKWAIPLTVLSLLISYSIRRSYILFGIFFLTYFVLTSNLKESIKDKYNWIGLIIGVILFVLVELTIFSSGISTVSQGFIHPENQGSLEHLKVFSLYFSNISQPFLSILLYLFYIGIAILAVNLFLSFGHIKKNILRKADLFVIVSILVTLIFFISTGITLEVGEPRWYFPLLFSSLICISQSSIFIFDKIKKYNKEIALLVIFVLISFSVYYEVNHANSIISGKTESFNGIRSAGLYLKENTDLNDKVLTLGQPQVEYYSERSTVHARNFVDADPSSEEHFYKTIEKLKTEIDVNYLIISFSEPGYPSWMRRQTQMTWEIPFMESKIDFANKVQDIKQEKIFDNIKFTLIDVKEDVFIYRIERI